VRACRFLFTSRSDRSKSSAWANEVFLSTIAGGILNVEKIDGQLLPHFPGPITKRSQDPYQAIHDTVA
jgi:hypothetical protein